MRHEDVEKVIRSVAKAAANDFVFEKFPDAQVLMGAEIRTAPAAAMARTDAGLVMVLDPSVLMGRSASELRESGMMVPNEIPDDATVVRDRDGNLVFKWLMRNSSGQAR